MIFMIRVTNDSWIWKGSREFDIDSTYIFLMVHEIVNDIFSGPSFLMMIMKIIFVIN